MIYMIEPIQKLNISQGMSNSQKILTNSNITSILYFLI